VAEVAAGRTTVVVTHAPHLLGSTFNVLLDAGRVAAVGTHVTVGTETEAASDAGSPLAGFVRRDG
jgi:ABC-type transport system involved in cytochrome bd biosynthesis fused ATPase/permease subunit